MNILVIDDDAEHVRLLVEELAMKGHQVQQVGAVRELEGAVLSFVYDGIVLDLMMPAVGDIPEGESQCGYLGGVVLYEKYIGGRWPRTPFVVVTAVDDGTSVFQEAIRRLGKFEGYRGWLSKPTEGEKILLQLGKKGAGQQGEQ